MINSAIISHHDMNKIINTFTKGDVYETLNKIAQILSMPLLEHLTPTILQVDVWIRLLFTRIRESDHLSAEFAGVLNTIRNTVRNACFFHDVKSRLNHTRKYSNIDKYRMYKFISDGSELLNKTCMYVVEITNKVQY